MTRKEALAELLEKVKAGETYGNNELVNYDRIMDGFGFLAHYQVMWVISSWRDGSMDAALSLFEAVLPGWGYALTKQPEDLVYVRVWIDIAATFGWSYDTPSRALLIAVLEALVAMES